MNTKKYGPLVNRMRRGVAEDQPARITELEKALKDFRGNPYILRDILDNGNTDSPFTAAQRMPLQVAVFGTPKGKRTDPHGVSVSGHKLKDQYFLFSDPTDPTKKWTAGSQAAITFLETFGTAEQKEGVSPEGRKRNRERRTKVDHDNLRNIVTDLQEVLNDSERITDIQGNNDRTYVESLLGLQDELEVTVRGLDAILHGQSAFVDQRSSAYLVATDPGGMRYNRFKRKFDTLPDWVKSDWLTATDDLIAADSSKRKDAQARLNAYAAANFSENRKALIGTYQNDLDLLLKLPNNHEIIAKYGRPNLDPVRRILAEPEITFTDAGRVFLCYPVDKVRSDVNKEYLNKFQTEVNCSLETLKPLFLKNGFWRDDAMGSSIPMGRIKHAIYSAVLQRKELEPVRNLLREQTLSLDEQRTYQALSISQMKELVDGCVLAARKLKHLDSYVEKEGIEIANRQEASEIIAEHDLKRKPNLRRLGNWDIVENFSSLYGMKLDETIKRLNSIYFHNADWSKVREGVTKDAELGLVNRKTVEKVGGLVKQLKEFTPHADVKNDYEQALEIRKNVLFVHPPSLLERGRAYVSPNEVLTVNLLVKAKQQLDKIVDEQGALKISAMLEERKNLRKVRFYEGTIQDGFKKVPLEDPTTQVEGFQVLDVAGWGNYVRPFEENYIADHELSYSWKRKAHYLSQARDDLEGKASMHALHLSQAIQGVRGSYTLHKDLIASVEQSYQNLRDVLTLDLAAVRNPEVLEEGELYNSFNLLIRGTEFKHKTVFQGAVPGLSWNKGEKAYQASWKKMKAVGQILERVNKYNEEYGRDVYVEVERKG